MLNYIWAFMILIGVVYGAFTGKMAEVTNAELDGVVGGTYGDCAKIGPDCKADERDTTLHQLSFSGNSQGTSGQRVYCRKSDCQCAWAGLGVYACRALSYYNDRLKNPLRNQGFPPI